MTTININNSLILIIDIQEKLLKAAYNSEELLKNAKSIVLAAKILNIPILFTEQYPKGLGSTVEALKIVAPENSVYMEKTSFSALDNEEIFNFLKNSGKKQIILFGIETHICVSQTAAALKRNGYDIFFVEDASSSRAQKQHNAGIERIKTCGVEIITAEIALFEWLKTSKHPNFKEIQALIK